jgi:hypothetical protein
VKAAGAGGQAAARPESRNRRIGVESFMVWREPFGTLRLPKTFDPRH